mgnify:FL=1
MKLQNLVSKLEKHHKKKIDLSLDRTYSLLNSLGNPHEKLQNVINVVGTNSKASMAYSLKAILNEAGYKCNLYTSPHLQSYTERFIFNDKEISEDDLIKLLNDTEEALGDNEATVFEILTCAFYKYAENYKDNINIIESGLFFRMDPSSVFKKNICTLLGVCHSDHYQWLENKSIDGVIYEKTSKLLNSNIFVNKQVNDEIREKIEKALEKNKSNKFYFGEDFNISRSENGFIQYQDELGELVLPEPNLLGEHQLYNISTAINASRKLFNVTDDAIKKGIQKIDLKGRLQEIKNGKLKNIAGKNRLVIDGGHNISAALSIAKWIKSLNEEVNIICGMLKDKDHLEFMKCFEGTIGSATLIDIPNQENGINKEELKNKLSHLNIDFKLADSIEQSIKLNSSNKNTITLIVGSLYLVGEILNLN